MQQVRLIFPAGWAVPYACVAALAFSPVEARASSPFFFVDAYIRNTAAVDAIRDQAKAELKRDHSTLFADCIRNSEKYELQFGGAIKILQRVDLGDNEAKDAVPGLINFYQEEIDLYDELSKQCQKFVVPDPAVDYGKLAANSPKITARLDYVDHAIFQATPLVFATLIDPKPDAQNHISRLVITRDEKARLVHDLNSYFGAKMDEPNQNWFVSSASILRDYLTKKGFRASDEP